MVTPLQYAVSAPFDLIDWMSTSLATQKQLLAENTQLRVQAMLLNAQLQKLFELERENAQLRALLESAKVQTTNTKVLVVQVLAVDSDPFVQEVIIDRGGTAGVYVGQPVLDATGIMGQVVSIAPSVSRIMLLSDTRSAIPIELARNGLRGIVVGRGAYDDLALVHIPAAADVKVGDQLVSSGLGQRYPVGYPVGIVTQTKHYPGQPFMDISVVPSAALDRSRLVLLIWPQQEQQMELVQQELNETVKSGKPFKEMHQRDDLS
jgi:rod shape-determining protein MreC